MTKRGLDKRIVDFFTTNIGFGKCLISHYPKSIPEESRNGKRKRYYKIDDSLDEIVFSVYHLEYYQAKFILDAIKAKPYEIRDSKTGDVLEVRK